MCAQQNRNLAQAMAQFKPCHSAFRLVGERGNFAACRMENASVIKDWREGGIRTHVLCDFGQHRSSRDDLAGKRFEIFNESLMMPIALVH
jgi:hypothetical protein